MAKASNDWKVLDHGPIERLADNIWRVEGALPGMSLRRTMTVVRRNDGSLLLHSPIALDDARQRELEQLGPIAVLAVPNAGNAWMPAIRPATRAPIFCPSGGRTKIADVVGSTVPKTNTLTTTLRFEMLDGLAKGRAR